MVPRRIHPRAFALHHTVCFLVILPFFLFEVAATFAASVVDAIPRRSGAWLVVDVITQDLLDERTRSTVESGLPGSCVLHVELQDRDGAISFARTVERSLVFDLWEDVARLTEGARERVFPLLAVADSAWARFDAIPLAPWTSLASQTTYRLRVHLSVQPLGQEERERVSRWVTRSEQDERRAFAVDLGGLVRRFVGGAAREETSPVWIGPPFALDQVRASEPQP